MISTLIVIAVMILIVAISLIGGSGGELRNDSHSAWAWAILLLAAGVAELYLIFVRGHTLSNQMQWWIHGQQTITGLIMFGFWVWLTIHFVVEPVVSVASAFLER